DQKCEQTHMHRVASLFILLVSFGVAAGAEFSGVIIKVDGTKLTFTKIKGGGEQLTLTPGDKLIVAQAKFNFETKKVEVGDLIPDGLKHPMFSSGKVNCRIFTDDNGSVTKILVAKPK